MATGFLWHELFAWHDAGGYPSQFVEPIGTADTPEGKRRIRNLLDVSGLLPQLTSVPFEEAGDEAILRVHEPAYLEALKANDEKGGDVARFAHFGPGGLKIVRLAAGAAIAAVDAVLDGKIRNVYALVRPAGHHASSKIGAGFCLVNNVAIAARHAISKRGLKRIAIVDWDVHHGNGTEEIFWSDPNVLTISIHQDKLFLDGGGLEQLGNEKGHGTNLNIPLPAGSGHGAYTATVERVVCRALERFKPNMILVASGLDASSHDALGRMNCHSETYREMTDLLMKKADELCGGRLALIHEGGYSSTVTPFIGLAILETLSGIATGTPDPFVASIKKQATQALREHEDQLIKRAEVNLQHVPNH